MSATRPLKVLMCCLGPETHNRGILTVSSMLRDAGMEVVYLGNSSPEEAIRTAIEEGVDVIGVSSLSGAHLRVGRILMDAARSRGVEKQFAFLMGGVIPPKDVPRLIEMGFDGVYPSGATREDIVNGVRQAALGKTSA